MGYKLRVSFWFLGIVVLEIGDFMVAAREVDFDRTAGPLLEKRLNNELGPKTGGKHEILNFEVGSYGTSQYFKLSSLCKMI